MPVQRSSLFRPLAIIAVVVASSLYAIAQQSPAPSTNHVGRDGLTPPM